MPDLIHCPPCRALAALTLLWLSACARHHTTPAAQLELIGAPEPTACDSAPAGDLRLQGLDAPVRVQISGAELCAGAPIQRELPPGLYTLSWQSPLQVDALGAGGTSTLRGPTMVSLFAEQLTLVRVQVEAPSTSGSSDGAHVETTLPVRGEASSALAEGCS